MAQGEVRVASEIAVRRLAEGKVDRLLVGISITGLAVLCFFGGSAVSEFRLFPYEQVLAPSFEAARSIKQQFETTSGFPVKDRCYPTDFAERGLIRHNRELAFDGVTVYTSGDHPSAFLIDMRAASRVACPVQKCLVKPAAYRKAG